MISYAVLVLFVVFLWLIFRSPEAKGAWEYIRYCFKEKE